MKYIVAAFVAGMLASKIAAVGAGYIAEDNAGIPEVYSASYTRELNRHYAERDGTHKAKED
jgi:hypothetical protein